MKCHIPKRALICYCPHEPTIGAIHNVNQLAAIGCSGTLSLEAQVMAHEQVISQLLGFITDSHLDNKAPTDLKAHFNERFPHLSLTILSNSDKVKKLASQIDCVYERLQQSDTIEQLLYYASSTTAATDVVFIDLSDYKHDAWHILNGVCEDASPWRDTLLCVISPLTTDTTNSSIVSSNLDMWWEALVPKQSYTKRNGVYLTDQGTTTLKKDALVYTMLHMGSTRKDGVKAYHSSTIQQKGCQRSMLAWHLMAEISYKIGSADKYGA